MKSFLYFKPTRAQFIAGAIISTSMILSYAAVTVPHTFTADTPAKASGVNENFEALTAKLTALEGMESGKTVSDGSIDKSPNPPDSTACSTQSCVIGSPTYPYPSGSWVYPARYTPPSNGVMTVTTGPAVECNGQASGAVLKVSMHVSDAAATFPPPAPGGAIGFSGDGTPDRERLRALEMG